MKTCLMHIKGMTPYSCSKMIDDEIHPKLEKETAADYDARLWREKATFTDDDEVAVPAMALKMCFDEAIKRLGLQIPGRGKTTYTKFFVSGQICEADMPIGIHKDQLESIKIYANADGVRGSGKRVKRRFPYIREWSGKARFLILDEAIPINIYERVAIEGGRLIGIGRFRPQQGGMLGRFAIERFEWGEA